MVEPPSRRLQQILLGLKLCSPRDLRRCASRVKALSADLPAFDSVWLDALVQRRVLSSWQAQTIELDQPELLRVGPCVVEDRIGQSHGSATYLARIPEQTGYCVVKRVSVPAELRKSVSDRLKQLIECTRGLANSGVIVPHSFSEVSNTPLPELTVGEKLKESAATRASRRTGATAKLARKGSKSGVGRARRKTRARSRRGPGKLQVELAIVSRFVDGLSLSEILLRRGRFPAVEVDAIARQLLESLAALHEGGIVHGEILLSNIRLLASGQVVLVDAGLRSALQPEFQINAHIAPEKNDGVPPELIGTGATATPRSDLYALGFALWQLLAGRPAFATGDPLAKLAAHQTERIPDIREYAPDTPEKLASTIEWLTQPVAARRPRNAQELLADLSRERSAKGRRTAGGVEKPATATENMRARTPGQSASGLSVRERPVSPDSGAPESPLGTIRPAGRASRRRLSKFASSFQQPLRRSGQPSSIRRTAKPLMYATAAMLLAVAALFTFDARSRSLVLASLPQRFTAGDGDSSVHELQTGGPGGTANAVDRNADPLTSSAGVQSSGSAKLPRSTADADEYRQHLESPGQEPTQAGLRLSGLLPLPEPDPYGVVMLTEPGTYEAGTINWSGSHLVLRGLPDVPVRIAVTRKALQLRATEVTLENVIVLMNPRTSAANVLSQIRSQKLTCLNCDFLTPFDAVETSSESTDSTKLLSVPALAAGIALQWAAIDDSDPLAGELSFSNCRLVGSHSSIVLKSTGRLLRCVNMLKVGGGPLVITTGRAAHGNNVIELEQTTLRQSGSLVAFDLRDGPSWNSRLTIRPESSVFDLRSRSRGEAESLVTFAGGRLQLTWHERVRFEGDGSIAGSTVGLASWQATDGSGHQALDAADVYIRGLVQTDFSFLGSLSSERKDSVLSDVLTNRVSSRLPGISANSDAIGSTENAVEPLLISPETGP